MTELYDIIYHPDAVLKQVSNPISTIDTEIKVQAERMMNTVLAQENSVGLAANQVNILNRMMVCEFNPDSWDYEDPNALRPRIRGKEGASRRGNPILMINPEIIKKSDRRSICTEGCLSLPNQFADVERHSDITLQYLDTDGNNQELNASGFDAHVVQHELDHLNGVLFIDYLSRLKRGTLVRKLEKYKKSEGLL
jgi:peptide deformylase